MHTQRSAYPKWATFAALMLMLTLAFAACGGGSNTTGTSPTDTPTSSAPSATAAATNTPGASTGAATINMGFGQFSGNVTVTIKAGQSVTFDDTSGGPHNLVTGMGGAFSQETGAPAAFTSNGIGFNGGDKKTVTFPTAGVYHITCTFHPSMQATVTVTA